jgi:hypothetical protein
MTHGDHIRIDVLTSSQEIVVTIGVTVTVSTTSNLPHAGPRGEAVSGALFSAGGAETQVAYSSSDTSSTEEMTAMCSLRLAGPAGLGFALRPQRHLLLVDSGLKAGDRIPRPLLVPSTIVKTAFVLARFKLLCSGPQATVDGCGALGSRSPHGSSLGSSI